MRPAARTDQAYASFTVFAAPDRGDDGVQLLRG